MLRSTKLSCQENNADLASTPNFYAVLHSSKFIKLFNILVCVFDVASKCVLNSVSKHLLGRLHHHLVDRLLDSAW